ncbi:hypothetical protein CEXT_441881 [Caerostris extrusa]|uniref:Uncharacterized protein n=1 Tax=Caerostris extrusa TaxID=172846 RepID=A0AAV4RKD9_CAEEX|nr:hypothetical protein CEXT_441881 [Caerostris extrusa]
MTCEAGTAALHPKPNYCHHAARFFPFSRSLTMQMTLHNYDMNVKHGGGGGRTCTSTSQGDYEAISAPSYSGTVCRVTCTSADKSLGTEDSWRTHSFYACLHSYPCAVIQCNSSFLLCGARGAKGLRSDAQIRDAKYAPPHGDLTTVAAVLLVTVVHIKLLKYG